MIKKRQITTIFCDIFCIYPFASIIFTAADDSVSCTNSYYHSVFFFFYSVPYLFWLFSLFSLHFRLFATIIYQSLFVFCVRVCCLLVQSFGLPFGLYFHFLGCFALNHCYFHLSITLSPFPLPSSLFLSFHPSLSFLSLFHLFQM